MRYRFFTRCAVVLTVVAGGMTVPAAQSSGGRRAMTIEDLIVAPRDRRSAAVPRRSHGAFREDDHRREERTP